LQRETSDTLLIKIQRNAHAVVLSLLPLASSDGNAPSEEQESLTTVCFQLCSTENA
jgi:hypothetical protein